MEINVEKVVIRYKRLLNYYLSSTRKIEWKRTAQELECLARYAIDHSDRITIEFFERQLYKELRLCDLYPYTLPGNYRDFTTSYNGLFCKLHYLKGHISERWLNSCKVKYVSLAVDELPRLLSTCCDDYILKDKNCLQDSACLFECIKRYESSLESNSDNFPGKLTGFDAKLLSRVVRWINKYEKDFGRVYVIWKKTEEVLKLYSSSTLSDSPAFQLFSNDRHLLVPKILENYVLSPDTVFSVYNRGGYDGNYEFNNHDLKYYYSNKGLRWKKDLDLLLKEVILVDDFRCGKLYRRHTLKCEFENSLSDVGEFHAELFNYIKERFQTNYNNIRKNPNKTLLKSEEIWINALSTFLIHYLPSLNDFVDLILRKLILPQVITLCRRFKPFYQHKACLEKCVFDNVCNTIPNSVLEFKDSIEWIMNSPIDSKNISVNGPIIDEVFMPRPVAEQFDLSHEEEPIWPNQDFKNYWNEQLGSYLSERKNLHGCFSKHLILMKLPIPSSNSVRITFITTLSIASILNLYNDSAKLKIDEIRTKLAINNSQEIILRNNLQKLLNLGLLRLTKDNFYIFNYEFKEKSSTEKFLRLI